MLTEVGIRLGVTPPHLVEETMTREQIELHYYWLVRAQRRQAKIDENATVRGMCLAFNGS